jgi:hypothetical protein
MAKATQPASSRDESEKGTRQVRVFDDVGEMISWIIKIEGGTTAALLDPMIRDGVVARYRRHEEAIKKIRAAEEELEKALQEAKSQAGSRKKKPE